MRELERTPHAHPARPDPKALPAIAVIGAGRLGRAVTRTGLDSGLDMTLAGRSDALAACDAAEVALLCVPDSELTAACETVAAAVPPLRFVGHPSGASGLDALAAAERAGAASFSLHPLQTVPDGDATLAGAPAAIAGSTPAALELARALAEHLGMRPFEVPESARAAYHAAASISSNFLVALEESAAALLESTGVEDARELLAPLVLRTAANWAERGPEALTGPIARGDEDTVGRHLAALERTAPELVELYRVLAERTRALARDAQGESR